MSVNKVILVGNLGKDPELRYTPSGTAVCTFSLATTDRFKNKQGEQQDRTEWHNIVVWAGLAEVCGKYLTKGKQIYVEGRIQNRSYDDRDGNKRYISEVVVNEMQMLGRAGDQGGGGGGGYGGEQQSPGGRQSQPQGSGGGQPSYGGAQQSGNYKEGQAQEPPFNMDDEIPF